MTNFFFLFNDFSPFPPLFAPLFPTSRPIYPDTSPILSQFRIEEVQYFRKLSVRNGRNPSYTVKLAQ